MGKIIQKIIQIQQFAGRLRRLEWAHAHPRHADHAACPRAAAPAGAPGAASLMLFGRGAAAQHCRI